MPKLNNQIVRTLELPAGTDDKIFFDDDLPGFGVRLRRQNKSWIIQYRFGGKQRRESLGDVRKIDIEPARKIARQRFAQIELGVDPAAERERASAQALTLGTVADRYLEAKQERLRPNSFRGATRYLTDHWAPLRNQPLGEIKRADVAARLQVLAKERGRTAAARARDNLCALYSWSMREGLCESNPVIATNDPAQGIPTRDRVLSDDEIRAIWGDDDFGRILKLLLLTGARRDEIGGLQWSEIDFKAGVLVIPGTRTKNHRTLELKLPGLALDILRSQPRRREDFVFGGRGGAFSTWSFSGAKLGTRIVEAEGKPLAPWRLHDLRRTMRSNLGKLGVAPHVAEMAINHVKGGVEAIYDRHRYQREIGAALALWADRVCAIVEGRESNVTVLHSA